MKSFKDYMNDISEKLNVEGKKVQMTPKQFEYMCEQFYNAGKANGIKEGERKGNKSNPFGDVPGFGDLFR